MVTRNRPHLRVLLHFATDGRKLPHRPLRRTRITHTPRRLNYKGVSGGDGGNDASVKYIALPPPTSHLPCDHRDYRPGPVTRPQT